MKKLALLFALLALLPSHDRAATKARADANTQTLPRYDLSVNIVPDAHRLEATGTLWLPPASEARALLTLGLSDVMRDFQVTVIEPQACAGAVRLEKKEERNKAVFWNLYPKAAIPAGAAVRLQFSYSGGEEVRFVFYIGAEGSFAGGFNTLWYPQIEGNARSIGNLRFAVPAGYQVIATGRRQSAEAAESQGDFQFEVTQPSLFTFAAAQYHVERRTSADGRTTAAYLLRTRPRIGNYLDQCVKVMNVLTEEFGPNPYGDFALVETPTEQSRKAEFAGASFEGFIFSTSEFLDQDFNTAYYGHEIAHQWWGVSISKKSGMRGRMMLNEAMAQYGSLRAVEILEGARAAERYRRTGYPGYVDLQNATGYFMIEAAGFDQSLSALLDGPYTRIMADGKGFIVYDMLSRLIGREKFRRILHGITKQYAASQISWDEFLQAIQTGAGMDLQWFYEQWFDRKGAPEWQVSWQPDGHTVRGTITQSAPYFRATVEVLIEGDDYQTALQTVELRSERTEFVFPLTFRARSLTVDPHFFVLHRTPEWRALQPAFRANLRARDARDKQQSEEAETILREALAAVTEPDLYGVRFSLEFAMGQLLVDRKRFAEAKTHLQSALAQPTRRKELLARVYVSLAHAAKGLNDEALLRAALSGAESAVAATGEGVDEVREARNLLAK